jgi:hypothetical protein
VVRRYLKSSEEACLCALNKCMHTDLKGGNELDAERRKSNSLGSYPEDSWSVTSLCHQMLHKHVPWRDNIIMFDTFCLQFYVSELASLPQSLPSQIKPEQTVVGFSISVY